MIIYRIRILAAATLAAIALLGVAVASECACQASSIWSQNPQFCRAGLFETKGGGKLLVLQPFETVWTPLQGGGPPPGDLEGKTHTCACYRSGDGETS